MQLNPYEATPTQNEAQPQANGPRSIWPLMTIAAVMAIAGVVALIANTSVSRGIPRRYATYDPEYDLPWSILSSTTFGYIALDFSVATTILAIVRLRKRTSDLASF